MKLGLKDLNRLIIVMKQGTDRYILEIQKAQISIYFIFVEFAVLVDDGACRYGFSQSCGSFYY